MKIISALVSFISICLVFFCPVSALASETIRDFSSEIKAHKDGSFDVTEKIVYDFGQTPKHGIHRDIPLVSKIGDLTRTIRINFIEVLRDNLSESFTLTETNTQASIKIGKADTTTSGPHIYTISYQVQNGIGSNFEDHDELFWNITGNGWNVPILKASAKLTTDFRVFPNKATCYTGTLGSTLQNCDFSEVSAIKTTKVLQSLEGLSGVWGFPKDTFPPSILQKQNHVPTKTNKALILGVFAVPIFLNLILPLVLLIWYFKNKRKERFGSPSVNFDLPKDESGQRITPAESGSIDNYQVDQNDVIATIFDLAIRKYIKIEETKGEYLFIKLKDLNEGTTEFEQQLLNSIFESGDKVKLSSLKKDFYLTFNEFEKDVFQSLVNRGFYSKNPKNQMIVLLVFGIMIIFIGGILLGPVLIFLSRKLNGRTALGDRTDWQIDGLKIFLKNMKRHYTWQAQNLYTVEKYIPYAIAFGYIKEFMEQLKVIYPDYKPSWYDGHGAFYLASGGMFSSMSSSFTTHASSSSGFSGGGSSGGGGGGGGGGSW